MGTTATTGAKHAVIKTIQRYASRSDEYHDKIEQVSFLDLIWT
jgi:hypothetical protein